MSAAIIPLCATFVIIYALAKKVDVYSAFAAGAKDGLPVLVNILPYMAAMLMAINVFRESGALSAIITFLTKPLSAIGFPAELLPLALLRPFSGSASLALLSDVYAQYGPDSFLGRAASLMMGSSETIFYTVALYFGAIKVTKTRYCVPVALISGAVGILCSLLLAGRMG